MHSPLGSPRSQGHKPCSGTNTPQLRISSTMGKKEWHAKISLHLNPQLQCKHQRSVVFYLRASVYMSYVLYFIICYVLPFFFCTCLRHGTDLEECIVNKGGCNQFCHYTFGSYYIARAKMALSFQQTIIPVVERLCSKLSSFNLL